jgi:hypothetical protein
LRPEMYAERLEMYAERIVRDPAGAEQAAADDTSTGGRHHG